MEGERRGVHDSYTPALPQKLSLASTAMNATQGFIQTPAQWWWLA